MQDLIAPRGFTRQRSLRWIVAIAAAAIVGVFALLLARVDANIGPPYGPDRIVRALDATPAVAPADAGLARLALRMRPVDGAAYRVLAQVEDAAGHADRAAVLHATALAHWPRDRIARGALAGRAFVADDIDAALLQLDALLRVAPTLRVSVLAALMPTLEDPRIRDGLVARLAAGAPWRGALVPVLLDEATPVAAAEALLADLATRTVPTSAELQGRQLLLERLGRPVEARATWLASLGREDRAAAALLFDGGFERPDAVGRYAWQLTAPAGAAIGYDAYGAPAGASLLSIRFDGRAVRFTGVSQQIALPTGRYRLQMRVRQRVETSRPFVWHLACITPDPAQLAALEIPAMAHEWQSIATDFEVPADCRSQRLQLRHAARSLSEQRLSGELLVDSIDMTRLD